MAYEFHYTPIGTGVISGKEVLEQTEDAINDLGNTAISGVQEALDKAEQALTNSADAVDDAQTALNTANNAEGVAIQAQNNVSNLSGTVTNIGNRVTTAEGNITNLQGRMTTAEGNITNLQGRMTTAEGNIGNLQTAVSTAQATANSAQQTATTARQQSYVLRHSGTAITDNSTIGYSTLDNTDNIKASDKIIDVDGKIFSIVSVDTVNQTVTVGSALIDLALDSNVVHTSGNETVGGQKTFSDTATFSSVNIDDIRWKSLSNQTIDLNDCYIPRAGAISGYYTTDISSGANISNKALNTAFTLLSLTTRRVSASDYQVRQVFYGSGSKYIRTCSNGTWTNWVSETDKYVTTDTNQTVGGAKTFSEDITIYNSDTSQTTKRLVITSSKVNLGDSNSDSWGISFNAGSSYAATINSEKDASSTQGISFTVRTKDGNNNLISTSYKLRVYTDGSAYLIPNATGSISLGSSSNKWKDVQTNLVNGLVPSSLSLPVIDRTKYVDISGYFTNTGSGDINTYNVTANGWVYLRLTDIGGCQLSILDSSNNRLYGSTATGNLEQLCLPVTTGTIVETQWTTSTSVTVAIARFIPCLGNV